jgi:hypothetical protein
MKPKEVNTGLNLAEFPKEGCGSKKGCFASDDPPHVSVVWCSIN